jgi:hypothetical protein
MPEATMDSTKMYVLLYPSTLIETLIGYDEMTLVQVVKSFAGNPGNAARFDIIKGIFSSEDAARLAARLDYGSRGKDAHWAEDYIVNEYPINEMVMPCSQKPLSTIDRLV